MVIVSLKDELRNVLYYLLSRQKINKIRKKSQEYSKNPYKICKKKLFCILEQGADKNNLALISKQKEIFTTNYSDFYRLNWKGDKDDKLADFFATNVSFSQGRSLLYEKTKGEYDFYIFIDDDVSINSTNSYSPAENIRDNLLRYKPLHGSIINNTWPELKLPKKGKLMGMRGGDQGIQIFRSDFAKFIFPTWIHGSRKSHWYAQFIAYILFPKSSIYLNNLIAENIRTTVQTLEFNNYELVMKFFEDKIIESRLKNLFKIWFEYSNSKIFTNRIYDLKEIQSCPYFEKGLLNLIIK